MDLALCNGSDHLKLPSKFVRIRTFVTDFGNNTKVPAAAASVFPRTAGWREGWGTRALSQEQRRAAQHYSSLSLPGPCWPQILQLYNFKV